MVYVTGDTHGREFQKLGSFLFPEGKTLTKSDTLIILGDFGLLWNYKRTKEEEFWIDWLSEKPWTTLVVGGNHENYNLIGCLPEIDMFGSPVQQVSDSIFFLKRGEVYNIDGKTFFSFGGAYSIDKPGRVIGESWWPQELPSHAEMERGFNNLDAYNWKVDYVVSHTGPININKQYCKELGLLQFFHYNEYDTVSKYLQEIVDKLNFKKQYYGHWHDFWCYQNKYQMLYDEILLVN